MPTTFASVSRLAIKSVLFPTDFSSASAAALPFAESIAQMYGSVVMVTHAIPPEPHRQVVTDAVPSQDHVVWEDARQRLDSFTYKLEAHHIPCKPLLDRGDVDQIIPAMIDENHIDLVVLGTHGRRGVTKLIVGSSAEKIYRCCSCPVLTIGPHVHCGTNWKLRRILCPVDLSEDPEPILHYALSLAEENQSEFIVLGAVPMVPWQHRPDVEQRTFRALESFIPEQAKS